MRNQFSTCTTTLRDCGYDLRASMGELVRRRRLTSQMLKLFANCPNMPRVRAVELQAHRQGKPPGDDRGADRAAVTRAIEARMAVRGFPRGAMDSLRSGITSLEEIEAGGGRFYYFR